MNIAENVLRLKQDFDSVFENGQKAIWKFLTADGTRENYTNAFQYVDLEYFEPQYDIAPTMASYMYAQTNTGGYVDLAERFERNGKKLDFSKCKGFTRAFYNSGVTRLGVIDCTSATSALDFTFGLSLQLHTIDKLIVDADNTYSNTFSSDSALENIEVEGEIGNSISFGSCKKLTHASLMSIINHLQSKTSGTFTLTIGTDNLAKLTDAEKAIATQKGWTLA